MSESESNSDATGILVLLVIVVFGCVAYYQRSKRRRQSIMNTNLNRELLPYHKRCCPRKKPSQKSLPSRAPKIPGQEKETYEYLSIPNGFDPEEGHQQHPDYTWAGYDGEHVHQFYLLKPQRSKSLLTCGKCNSSVERKARIRKRYKWGYKKDGERILLETHLEVVWQSTNWMDISEHKITTHCLAFKNNA